MRLDEIIKPNRISVEQAGPYLYHITNKSGLAGMLRDNKIGHEGDILSMTRDPEYSVIGTAGTVQIVLDRKNLELTHAVEPHEEIWKDEKGEEWSSGESEERIWEHPVPFTKQYVVQVNSKIPLHSSIYKKLKSLNIPLGKF